MRRLPAPRILVPLAALAGGALMGYSAGRASCPPAVAAPAAQPVPQPVSRPTQTTAVAVQQQQQQQQPEAAEPQPQEHGIAPMAPRPAGLLARLERLHRHPAMRWGVPSLTCDVVVREGLAVGFDRRARNPSWVAERLTRASVTPGDGVSRKSLRFFEESRIHPKFRAHLTDYQRSGYDRGHMAPAADHRASMDAMAATFTLANISPQVGAGFNRDYWGRLEKWTRGLTKVAHAVYVVTGPLYLPRKDDAGKWHTSYPCIGAYPGVSVPTHFFKAILLELPDGTVAVGCYVLPNAKIPDSTPLHKFRATLDSVDRAAGLLLFNLLPQDEGGVQPARLEDRVVCELPQPGWWLQQHQQQQEGGGDKSGGGAVVVVKPQQEGAGGGTSSASAATGSVDRAVTAASPASSESAWLVAARRGALCSRL